jgi:haloacid dehalogenase superfamily, subfamily IA, variant 1 with third motif having Dx(3-4)D or Dx(3-4)E
MTDVVWPEKLYDAYVFDMDGTIYLGDDLLPGAKRMVEELRRRGKIVRFLSNNPTKNPEQYIEKLEALGLPTPIEDVANTVVTTVRWLKHHHPEATVFPIAERPLIDALLEAGIRISDDPSEIDIVIASYDRTFDYQKLQIAFDAIWFEKRAFLIATNPDRFCPFPGGRGEPDCASIIAAIEACTGTKCREVIGKPNPAMLEEALGDANLENVIMVGDRLSTDIAMAVTTGIDSAMPLTGESTLADVDALRANERPTYVLDRVDRLIPESIWSELGWTEE